MCQYDASLAQTDWDSRATAVRSFSCCQQPCQPTASFTNQFAEQTVLSLRCCQHKTQPQGSMWQAASRTVLLQTQVALYGTVERIKAGASDCLACWKGWNMSCDNQHPKRNGDTAVCCADRPQFALIAGLTHCTHTALLQSVTQWGLGPKPRHRKHMLLEFCCWSHNVCHETSSL